jgi:RimJ/RimL family protein N-acetyltransferase
VLSGDLVQLRPLSGADLPVLYELASELATWELRSPSPPRPMTYESFEPIARQRMADPTSTEFGIVVGGLLVGRCGWFHEDPFARNAEVGIGLLPSARGQGYGTDALRVMCDFAFERANLHRLHLEVLASNTAAIASYRTIGFVEEGRRREYAWVNGQYVDDVIMALLRADFRARKGAQ